MLLHSKRMENRPIGNSERTRGAALIQRAAILSTGDELTTGRTLDTNANFIADKLVAAGLDVTAIIVVGDYTERITWAWHAAMRQADVIISTGGLGPTADDLTTETLSQIT